MKIVDLLPGRAPRNGQPSMWTPFLDGKIYLIEGGDMGMPKQPAREEWNLLRDRAVTYAGLRRRRGFPGHFQTRVTEEGLYIQWVTPEEKHD